MNDGIFILLRLHSKYFLRGFLRSVKVIYMGLKFLVCHDKNFYFIFLMQVLESKYANAMQKVNMDNYRVTSQWGFGILSPPNRTSPFGFNLRVYPSVLKMETLILASHDSPNWSIVSILA
jgi:hypothetical protein